MISSEYSSDKKLNLTIHMLMMLLVVLSLTLTIVESIDSLMRPEYYVLFFSIQLSILSVFLGDFLFRILEASRGKKWSKKIIAIWRHLFQPLTLIDLVVLSPLFFLFYADHLGDTHAMILRILRFTTVFNLFHFYRSSRVIYIIKTTWEKIWFELLVILIISLQCILISGVLFYSVEHGKNPEVTNIFDGIWWAVITLTTIGYGDVVPVTFLGRWIAMIVAIIGVWLVALPTGILASWFIHALQREHDDKDNFSDEFLDKDPLEAIEWKKHYNKRPPSVSTSRIFWKKS